MRRVLFVDDEPEVLCGLENSLRKHRKHWQMAFASSGEAALRELASATFDVVVTDMRMPGMDGAALLAQVKRLHPRCARLVLSGQADSEAILRAIPVTHQFLNKPCSPQALHTTIERVCTLQARVQDEAVLAMVGAIDRLPSLPQAYLELSAAIEQPNVGIAQLVGLVEKDPALSAKLLQLANSAFFGAGARTGSVRSAVSYLGADMLRTLVLSAHVFMYVDRASAETQNLLAGLCDHTAVTARLMRRFVVDPRRVEQAVAVALLHDIGLLVLAVFEPERAARIRKQARECDKPMYQVERELGGPTHTELGAWLLGSWGLPFDLVETAAFHHAPSMASEHAPTDLLEALHAAEALTEAVAAGNTDLLYGIDPVFAERSGLLPKLSAWRRIAEHELREERLP